MSLDHDSFPYSSHSSTELGGGRSLSPERGVSVLPSLSLCWLDMSMVGHARSVALSSTAGVFGRAAGTSGDAAAFERRCQSLLSAGINSVLTLSTASELEKLGCRQMLLEWLPDRLAGRHRHEPLTDGDAPSLRRLSFLLRQLLSQLVNGGKVLIHCASGRGRSCTLAVCLLLIVDRSMTVNDALASVQRLRGSPAVQSVRQYNTVCAFSQLLNDNRRHHHLYHLLLQPLGANDDDNDDDGFDSDLETWFCDDYNDDDDHQWSDESRPVSR